MDWRDPKPMEGGARGSYQKSESPAGYCVTFTIREDGSAFFTASFRDKAFGHFYIDDAKDKNMARAGARAMRGMCGLHLNKGVAQK